MTQARVLLIDDEKENLEALRRLLRKEFAVHTAESGEAGLQLMGTEAAFDVIVSDQRMPGLSGSEFLEKAQAIDPVATRILLTGFSDLESVIEAVNRGHIWRYVAKPWEPEDFKLAVRQAAERSQLRRSLDESRRRLEAAHTELKAKDWARERLLQILLHEFRTAPQVLQNLESMDPGGDEAPTRLQWLGNLRTRFGALESEVTELLNEEKQLATRPRERVLLSEVLKRANLQFDKQVKHEDALFTNAQDLAEVLRFFYKLMADNSAGLAPQISLDGSNNELFLSLHLHANTPLLPRGLAGQKLETRVAWAALLEPFVGLEDFTRHGSGLRLEAARQVRRLAALGGRCEFQLSGSGHDVELLLLFQPSL